MKAILGAIAIAAAVTALPAQANTASLYGGKFVADAGQSKITTKRAGCGGIKETAFYHEIEFMQDRKFIERVYIKGIEQPDLALTGEWHEAKKRIYLNYDGAINDGSINNQQQRPNTGWAPLMGEIENLLAEKCRMVGIKLVYPATEMKSHYLIVNNKGTKAKLKMKLKSRSEGGYTKPRPTARSNSASGSFKSNPRAES